MIQTHVLWVGVIQRPLALANGAVHWELTKVIILCTFKTFVHLKPLYTNFLFSVALCNLKEKQSFIQAQLGKPVPKQAFQLYNFCLNRVLFLTLPEG